MHYELFKAEIRSQEYLELLKRYNNVMECQETAVYELQ